MSLSPSYLLVDLWIFRESRFKLNTINRRANLIGYGEKKAMLLLSLVFMVKNESQVLEIGECTYPHLSRLLFS